MTFNIYRGIAKRPPHTSGMGMMDNTLSICHSGLSKTHLSNNSNAIKPHTSMPLGLKLIPREGIRQRWRIHFCASVLLYLYGDLYE